jgi:hypothetical protein
MTTPRVTLVVNHYQGGPETTASTVRCWADDSWQVVRTALPCDAQHVAHDALLERDVAVELQLPRHLPFVHELLDVAAMHQTEWIGLANADLSFEPSFFEWFAERLANPCGASASPAAVAIHRRDVDDTWRVASAVQWGSMDACLMRRAVWLKHRPALPDYIFGAPAWDMGWKAWCLGVGLVTTVEYQGEGVLHRTHTGAWRRHQDDEGVHNRVLYAHQMSELVRRGFTSGLHIPAAHWVEMIKKRGA